MSVLCYCKKCGRIVQEDSNSDEDYKCDYCISTLFPIPKEYLDEDLPIIFKDKNLEEQFINEYIKSSP